MDCEEGREILLFPLLLLQIESKAPRSPLKCRVPCQPPKVRHLLCLLLPSSAFRTILPTLLVQGWPLGAAWTTFAGPLQREIICQDVTSVILG